MNNVENNPLIPYQLICEIEYFTAFSALKKLAEKRKNFFRRRTARQCGYRRTVWRFSILYLVVLVIDIPF